ncbi:hypothetical protein ACSBR1_040200 [Camellia fascicularis]
MGELARGLGEKGTIVFSDVEHAILQNDRSLQEVFKLFDLIHIVTTDHKILTRITQEVVEDFAAENVVYLELRTTPKEPLKVSRLLKEIIKVSSGYHHSSAITGVVGQVGLLSRVHFFFLLSLEETEYANTKSKVRNMEERHENVLLDYFFPRNGSGRWGGKVTTVWTNSGSQTGEVLGIVGLIMLLKVVTLTLQGLVRDKAASYESLLVLLYRINLNPSSEDNGTRPHCPSGRFSLFCFISSGKVLSN